MPVPFYLKTIPNVFFFGHGNSGAGFALRPTENSADLPGAIQNVDDFMHLRNARSAIPWREFKEGDGEYPNFGDTAITDSQIPAHPKNYAVNITGFSKPILDGSGNANNERFPNVSDGNTPVIHAGGTFNLKGTGIDRHHMLTKVTEGEIDPFLIVNLTADVKPKFRYKLFFLEVCNGARDYSEVFNHGCFISTTDFTSFIPDIPVIIVQTLLDGGDANAILSALDQIGFHDFT